MEHFFDFMAENPWQTFFLGPIFIIFLSLTVGAIISLLTLVFNALTILLRGWPSIKKTDGFVETNIKSDEGSDGDFSA